MLVFRRLWLVSRQCVSQFGRPLLLPDELVLTLHSRCFILGKTYISKASSAFLQVS